MNYRFLVKTKIYYGENALKINKNSISGIGNKAIIVTGKNSGYKSGALDDIIKVLKGLSIKYLVYDNIENNPTLENVDLAADAARGFGANFIVGVGGGSPLDASKAVAVLAVNEMDLIDIFGNKFKNKPLPIIAIPTTAGTGSEVTPYSILTRNDIKTKMSFGNEETFPEIAFVDPSYTMSMDDSTTINTAVDAFTHSLEGYLSLRSTPLSDALAIESIRIFGKNLGNLENSNLNLAVRDELLYMSMLGGMVISQTGTTILHGMGYALTYFQDIPHGKANGLLMKEYLEFSYLDNSEKIDNILRLLNIKDLNEFGEIIKGLMKYDEKLTEEELKIFIESSLKQRSINYTKPKPDREAIKKIFKNSLM